MSHVSLGIDQSGTIVNGYYVARLATTLEDLCRVAAHWRALELQTQLRPVDSYRARG